MSLYRLSVFLVWLLTGSSVVGILMGYQDWFAERTYLNLSLFAILLVLNYPLESSKKLFIALFITLMGVGIEMVGIHTGFPFGEYRYGDNLGIKIYGVPIFIGINWLYLSLGMASISNLLFPKKVFQIILGSLLMVAIDILIEPGARLLDYWEFEQLPVPVGNYIGWFGISLVIQSLIQLGGLKEKNQFTFHLVGSTLLFFTALLITNS